MTTGPAGAGTRDLLVGVDVGGSKIAVIVVDRGFVIRGRHTIPTAVGAPAGAADHIAERSALEILHRHVRLAVVLADFVHDADVRMIEGRGGFGLLDESLHPICILSELARKNFDRYFAAEPGVARAIDFTHPSGAERGQNLVMPDHPSHLCLTLTTSERSRLDFHRRSFQEAPGSLVRLKQRFNFPA